MEYVYRVNPGEGWMRLRDSSPRPEDADKPGPWHQIALLLYTPKGDPEDKPAAFMGFCGIALLKAMVETDDEVKRIGELCSTCGSMMIGSIPRPDPETLLPE